MALWDTSVSCLLGVGVHILSPRQLPRRGTEISIPSLDGRPIWDILLSAIIAHRRRRSQCGGGRLSLPD